MELTGAWAIFEEGAVVEILQSVMLAGAALLCLGQWRRESRRISRSVPVLFGLVFVTIFLREVDVEDLAVPQIFIFLGSGSGRNAWLGTAWAAYGWFALSRWPVWLPQMRHLLQRSAPGWAFLAGCACYLAGFPFDKEWLPIGAGPNLVVEELLEAVGCSFFLVSALLLLAAGVPAAGSSEPLQKMPVLPRPAAPSLARPAPSECLVGRR
jgi:hypothetical protein